MECKTPVIGKIPNMIPEWMESVDEEGNAAIKNNGVWTNTTLNIPELIATYMKVWLEDAVPTDLLDAIDESTGKYTEENQQTIIKSVYENLIAERKAEFDNILANAIKSEETEISTQNK